MIKKIFEVTIEGKQFHLYEDEARSLYQELKEFFEPRLDVDISPIYGPIVHPITHPYQWNWPSKPLEVTCEKN